MPDVEEGAFSAKAVCTLGRAGRRRAACPSSRNSKRRLVQPHRQWHTQRPSSVDDGCTDTSWGRRGWAGTGANLVRLGWAGGAGVWRIWIAMLRPTPRSGPASVYPGFRG